MTDLLIPCLGDVIVSSSEVLYIGLVYKGKAPKIEVHTKDSDYYSKITGSVDALEVLFSTLGFVRVDSGVIANLNHFSRFERNGFGVNMCFIDSLKTVRCSRAGHTKAKSMMEQK